MYIKNLQSLLRIFFYLVLLIIPFNRCSTKHEKENAETSKPYDDTTAAAQDADQAYGGNQEPGIDFIHFNGSQENEIRKTLEGFSPFEPVSLLAQQFINMQDSLESARQLFGEPLTDPQDTLMLWPLKNKAYQAILDYKKQMASGVAPTDHCPGLLELMRVTEANDSSLNLLPEAGPSNFFSDDKFFFIGGAPFVSKVHPENNNIFTDPQGKPETHFGTDLTENASYLLTSIYHAMPGAIEISYGPPLNSYDEGPVEVHGIGSLTHRFVRRIPAFFITEEGLLPGHLLSANLKLAADYSCGDGPVYIEFACAKSIEANDILGIYIPYNTPPLSCTFHRLSKYAWTVDLDHDGTPDLACVSDTYEGEINETVAEALWFVNINGTWKIIDWAQEPECT